MAWVWVAGCVRLLLEAVRSMLQTPSTILTTTFQIVELLGSYRWEGFLCPFCSNCCTEQPMHASSCSSLNGESATSGLVDLG